MSENEFLKRFVVRQEIFDEIFEELQEADYSVSNQHYIMIGQRGQGKTTLLRKLKLEVEQDKNLSSFLIPVKFSEEQYRIRQLCRLWEEVAGYLETYHEDIFENILDELEQHIEDENYHLKCFSYLEKTIKKRKKKLLLLIDNIDVLLGKFKEKEQHQFREILLTSSSFIIVGGSTKMFEQQYDYSKPFYEFFKIIRLESLSHEESVALLRVLGNETQSAKIETIIKNTPERIEALRRVTGGVPRTIIMLFDIFIEDNGNAFDDLMKVLDEATPLYKDRMDDLPPILQEIVDTIALNWDGMTTREIAKKTRMESKSVSAQLKQLEKYQIIESTSIGKNKIYILKERFFNIWYLMRFGRKKDRNRVEWLIKFLLSWYDRNELESKAKQFMKTMQKNSLNESYVYYMGEALSYSGCLRLEAENNLKQNMKSCLADKAQKAYDKAEEYCLKALESSNTDTNNLLVWLYFEQGIKSDKALEIIKKDYRRKHYYHNTHTYAVVLLWKENFERSYEKFVEWLVYEDAVEAEVDMVTYFTLLVAKGQYYKAKEFMEIPEYQLKERYKPIWYALMTLMQDEFPVEIKKMGSELKETVGEVLEEIEVMKEKYKLEP